MIQWTKSHNPYIDVRYGYLRLKKLNPTLICSFMKRGCHGHDRMIPITTNVVSFNSAQARCTRYNIM